MRMAQLKLRQILKDRGMTQKKLAELSGVREATINVIVRNAQTSINFVHLAKIMDALEIEDFNEILVIE